MNSLFLKLSFLFCLFLPLTGLSQHIEFGHVFPSNLENREKTEIGKGGMQYATGSMTLPLSIKRDSLRGVRTWIVTVSGKYATLDNEGGAKLVNPNAIINSGAMITHVRTLNPRWNMIATAGLSLNATPDYIRTNCLSLTAGTIFSYTIRRGLNLGFGLIVTTAYGEPVCIPVPFITWKKSGRINYELNMRGMPEFKISSQVTPKLQVALSPFDTERFSAVVPADGKHKVYSNNLIKTTLEGAYHISKHVSLKAEAGYIYYHKVKLVERSFNAFWSNMFNSKNAYKFQPSFSIEMGLRYRI
jgi:hypothetical protein